jgi:predicted AAA+ superfamily ATPase
MVHRILELPKDHSFLLLGPRQTGKSTLLKTLFAPEEALYYDLLRTSEYLRLLEKPSLFREEVLSRDKSIRYVIVDEVQKVPYLLDEIHSIMENETQRSPYFCMSGSSARKLKKSHSNLLAGRAWTYQLHPLTHRELGQSFSLKKALNLGTLPSVYLSPKEEDGKRTLKTYVETYLKEEIEQEALTRNLRGFLSFLLLAADQNGNLVNFSNIAREAGINYLTAKEYFQILEDTLVGFMLLPYSRSVRKRLLKHSKFYFFDTGVQRALAKKISLDPEKGTSEYGKTFEHFFILEAMRLADYRELDYQFFFYRTSAHAEVDLVIETPKGELYAIEIKATENPDLSSLGSLKGFKEDYPHARLYCACLGSRKRTVGDISILPWDETLEAIGI